MWDIVAKFTVNFANEHHQTQRNCSNCFGWKQLSKTLHQAKISNYQYEKLKTCKNAMIYLILLNIIIFSRIPIFSISCLTIFYLMKGLTTLFSPETTDVNFVHLMIFICNVFIHLYSEVSQDLPFHLKFYNWRHLIFSCATFCSPHQPTLSFCNQNIHQPIWSTASE